MASTRGIIKGIFAILITAGFLGYTRAVNGAESSINFSVTMIATSVTIAGLTFFAGSKIDRKILMSPSKKFILAAFLFLSALSTLGITDLVKGTPFDVINAHISTTARDYPLIILIGSICLFVGIYNFTSGLMDIYQIASDYEQKD